MFEISDTIFFVLTVIRANVPRLCLDEVFEQKTETANIVANELKKVMLYEFAAYTVVNGSINRSIRTRPSKCKLSTGYV